MNLPGHSSPCYKQGICSAGVSQIKSSGTVGDEKIAKSNGRSSSVRRTGNRQRTDLIRGDAYLKSQRGRPRRASQTAVVSPCQQRASGLAVEQQYVCTYALICTCPPGIGNAIGVPIGGGADVSAG